MAFAAPFVSCVCLSPRHYLCMSSNTEIGFLVISYPFSHKALNKMKVMLQFVCYSWRWIAVYLSVDYNYNDQRQRGGRENWCVLAILYLWLKFFKRYMLFSYMKWTLLQRWFNQFEALHGVEERLKGGKETTAAHWSLSQLKKFGIFTTVFFFYPWLLLIRSD